MYLAFQLLDNNSELIHTKHYCISSLYFVQVRKNENFGFELIVHDKYESSVTSLE